MKLEISRGLFLLTVVGLNLLFPASSEPISWMRCHMCRLMHGRDVCAIYGRAVWDKNCNYVPPEELYGVFEGDIKEDYYPGYGTNCTSGRCPQQGWPFTQDYQHRLWQGGVVPYVFDENFGRRKEQIVTRAMNDFHYKTCVKFVKRTNENFYVKFINEKGCWSHVGRQSEYPTPQKISLNWECITHGIVLHELMHLLGFFHEQSRPDRDRYVRVRWRNILPKHYNNFQKYPIPTSQRNDIGYDYNSILHYPHNAFARLPWLTTIVPIDKRGKKLHGVEIGQRDRLSEKDVREINILYKCSPRRYDTGDRRRVDYSMEEEQPSTLEATTTTTTTTITTTTSTSWNRWGYRPRTRTTRAPRTRPTTPKRTQKPSQDQLGQHVRRRVLDEEMIQEHTTTTTTTKRPNRQYYNRDRSRQRCEDENDYCPWLSANFCRNFDCLRKSCRKTCRAC